MELKVGARGVGYATKGFTDLGVEPRVNLDIHLNRNNTLNINYMKIKQFSHLLFTSGTINSSEVWIPSGNDVPSAQTEQIAVGWRNSFHNDMFDSELNIYHKAMRDLATYREGFENLMGDGHWRSKVVTGGEGTAYGAELFIRKNHGSWTGFASYAWSRATRRFDAINNGQEYIFEYDRPHTASLSVSRRLGSRFNLTAAWVYQAGLPFTPAIGRHYAIDIDYSTPDDLDLFEALSYGKRNSERMRDYHRLDLSLQFDTHTRYSGYKAQWTFAIYNAYNRRNAYYYYYGYGNNHSFTSQTQGRALSLYQLSVFPIIPTVSYKVFFDREERLKRDISERQPWYRRLLYH